HRSHPDSSLTDAHLRTSLSRREQSPLLFVKQALALRYLRSLMGKDYLGAFLRTLTQERLFADISPALFFAGISSYSYGLQAEKRRQISEYLRRWWTSHGWSDLSLLSFEKKPLSNGQWLA